eukprot:CAMPEP_0197025448 /NCGR_PEP_ID=MMETSP1384-20130603/5784_1 /TAXON_ID=29189 /ORGANISM="Ammonia sp." /LENGTH=884 /DNA_ID=CAMNT_0042453977 /DNA_START=20 /DNA_END=2674 /DNA_ORIENTATION=+
MSQLFTLQFPKYHFDQVREFSLGFPDANHLPFSYEIINGSVYVDQLTQSEEEAEDVSYQKLHQHWIRMGLGEGVRIIKIGQHDISNDHMKGKAIPLAVGDIRQILREEMDPKQCSIDISFREEILALDDSKSLGLTHDESVNYEDSPSAHGGDDEEEAKRPHHHKATASKKLQLLGISDENPLAPVIKNSQIAASSCQDGFDPFKCRLNHPSKCWKPHLKAMKMGNSWIQIDLKERKFITKILIQGSKGNEAYIKSFWLDSSDDASTWKCHNGTEGEYKCVFNKTDEGYEEVKTTDDYAEVVVWPPIHGRFIRIRPHDYHKEIALRFDLHGVLTKETDFAREVRFGDLPQSHRADVIRKYQRDLPVDKLLIQVDCRALIRGALDKAGFDYVGFLETDKDNYLAVFSTADLTATERTIEELLNIGIGRAMGIAGLCSMNFRRAVRRSQETLDEIEKKNKEFQQRMGVTTGFFESIKSRQIVDQLVDNTLQSAEFTYDYMSMLLVADVIAAMGLGTDSAVIVVASMLVSPIMGPVLALTFGVHLRKFKFAKALARLGVKNEIWSLMICICVGFIAGFVLIAATQNEGRYVWPTGEMRSRGEVAGLATGAIVAFASGVGVALSVVGDYMATVIGVAISASLLPPAVNCGMLWAMSLYVYVWPDRSGTNETTGELYTSVDLVVMGCISIVLTIENIILVFLASWMMFLIKDVTMQGTRGYDDNNKQLVYQSITSFKDRFDDIKLRSSTFSLSRKPSLKRLAIKDTSKEVLGRPLDESTQDPVIRGRTLKKSVMSHRYKTIRGERKSGRATASFHRMQTEIDGMLPEDDEQDDFGGHSKIRLKMTSMSVTSPVAITPNRSVQEYEPLKEDPETEVEEELGDTNVNGAGK